MNSVVLTSLQETNYYFLFALSPNNDYVVWNQPLLASDPSSHLTQMKLDLTTLSNSWSRSLEISGFTRNHANDMIYKSFIATDLTGDDYIASCINRYSNSPSDIVITLDPEDDASPLYKAWEYSNSYSRNTICLDIHLKWETVYQIFVILENWDGTNDPHPSYLKI